MAVLLFSYGTLQERNVQLANFGRELAGRADVLPGYVVAMSSESRYANIEPSSEGVVSGMVFEVTEQELVAADRYEDGAEYRRISVVLRSGDRAWVYLRARS